jgi:hypothetical protein
MTEQVEDVLNQYARSVEGGLKPIVYYFEQLNPVVVGQRARVTAAVHYRLGNASQYDHLNTSPVVAVHEDGTTFETMNSMYILRAEPSES